MLSNDDTLAALRNEEDVMTKIFGNGTLKVCNEKMMLSIWGQAIELEEDPLEKEIVKTLAQDASQIDQDDIALSSPTVEALSLGSNTSIANFSIPLQKKVELRMKSSYQRDLEKIQHLICNDEYTNIDIGKSSMYMIQVGIQTCWTNNIMVAMELKDGSYVLDKLKDEYKHMNDEVLNLASTLQKSSSYQLPCQI